jgi:hypothetical protein
MRQFIQTAQDLETYLAPMSLDNEECVVFALEGFQSRLAMEMLQIRMRKQGQIYNLSDKLVPCMVAISERALRASRSVIQSLNAQISNTIILDPVMQIEVMRNFVTGLEEILQASKEFEWVLERGETPTPASYLRCVDAVTNYQSLDALKFSLKIEQVEQALKSVPGMNAEWCEDLCHPPQVSLFTQLYRHQLELLLVRLTATRAAYEAARSIYRKEWGFLEAEDLDFADFDTDAFVDSKIENLEDRFQGDSKRVREQLQDLEGVALNLVAAMNQRMNDLLNAMEPMVLERVRIYNLVRLWSSLLHHQEMNRWIKMRFFRNMHRLCGHGCLLGDEVGLQDLLNLLHARG